MIFNRRTFFKALGTIGVTSTIPSIATYAADKQSADFVITSGPYLQNFNKDSVVVMATFSMPCFAYLELLNDRGEIIKTIYDTKDGMRNANVEVFKFKVDHLNSDFKYRLIAKEITRFEAYKIEYGQTIESEIIRTELPFIKNETAHILILNDVHEYHQTYSDLYHQSSLPRKDLVILNGDSFHQVSKTEEITQKMTQPLTALFAKQTPFIMVRGNHETRGPYARNFKHLFDYPENKYYQSFLIGNLYVVILDGGEDKPDTHEVYAGTTDYDNYRLEQKAWLEKALTSPERKKAKHTIVINHIPWFHSDDWHGTLHNKLCFHEIVQKNMVTAVISGHTHKFGFYPPDKDHNYHVIIGGGPKVGTRTFVEIVTGNKLIINLKKDDNTLINSIG